MFIKWLKEEDNSHQHPPSFSCLCFFTSLRLSYINWTSKSHQSYSPLFASPISPFQGHTTPEGARAGRRTSHSSATVLCWSCIWAGGPASCWLCLPCARSCRKVKSDLSHSASFRGWAGIWQEQSTFFSCLRSSFTVSAKRPCVPYYGTSAKKNAFFSTREAPGFTQNCVKSPQSLL
jgi:hypothetical protein